MKTIPLPATFAAALFLAGFARASDWSTLGGDSARTGQSSEVGPTTATTLWTSPILSSGVPIFTDGNRAFCVTRLPTSTAQSMATCFDLDTGAVLWSTPVPSLTTSAAAWCLGASHGQVYATFGSKIIAFDAQTGLVAWQSAETFVSPTIVGAHLIHSTTAVFAPDGDVIVDAQEAVFRIRASDGTTAWNAPRSIDGIGGFGVAVRGNAVYAPETTPIQFAIMKIDLATGTHLYSSPAHALSGTSLPPFFGGDGTLYVSLGYPTTMPPPPPSMKSLLAFRDDGSALVELFETFVQLEDMRYATGPDGSVFRSGRVYPDVIVERLDPSDGSVLDTSVPIASQAITTSPIAVDAQGRVFLTTALPGPSGMITALGADLAPLWVVTLPTFADGGPALAKDGTLLVAGAGTVIALRAPRTSATVFCAGDGTAAACPCTPGYAGNGCANSAHASGARLSSDGVASVANDSFVLRALALTDAPALYYQGTLQVAGGAGIAFGDGLRCGGGTVVRLGQVTATGGASEYPGPGDLAVSVRGQIPPAGGVTRHYQVWYRNAAAFCTSATYNLTNGLSVTWMQ